jgi:hypothetical protein
LKKILFFIFIIGCCNLLAQEMIPGCLCKDAKNFDNKATINNGSCKYKKKKLKPYFSQVLDVQLNETSGLIKFKNYWLTHNDSSIKSIENCLYALNEKTFEIENKIILSKTKNIDWEALTQDSTHIYIGDFGNNNGNRQDLSIYKVFKKNLFKSPNIEIINFKFENQKSYANAFRNNNFDCEALIVKDTSIILFSKNWINQKCDIYYLHKDEANQEAKYITSFDSKGLITDAIYLAEKNEIFVCGYNKKLKPFIIKISHFNGLDFSVANFRRYKIKLPFHQVEAIYTEDGKTIWLTNENFKRKKLMINIEQKIHAIKLE